MPNRIGIFYCIINSILEAVFVGKIWYMASGLDSANNSQRYVGLLIGPQFLCPKY